MKVFWVVVALAVLPFFSLSVSPARAGLVQGECKSHYLRWQKQPGWKAFAKTSDGFACGMAWGHPSEASARAAALRGCRKSRRVCSILKVEGPRTSGKRAVQGGRPRGFQLSAGCRKAYANWKEKEDFKAFFTSQNGASCHATWRARSLHVAVKNAREGCTSPGDCNLYAIGAPDHLVKGWQQNLKVLGLYDSDIDGEWGPGSREAMARFARLAGVPDDFSDDTLERLQWASRIVVQLNLPVDEAIAESERAARLKSLAYLSGPDSGAGRIAPRARPEPLPEIGAAMQAAARRFSPGPDWLIAGPYDKGDVRICTSFHKRGYGIEKYRQPTGQRNGATAAVPSGYAIDNIMFLLLSGQQAFTVRVHDTEDDNPDLQNIRLAAQLGASKADFRLDLEHHLKSSIASQPDWKLNWFPVRAADYRDFDPDYRAVAVKLNEMSINSLLPRPVLSLDFVSLDSATPVRVDIDTADLWRVNKALHECLKDPV